MLNRDVAYSSPDPAAEQYAQADYVIRHVTSTALILILRESAADEPWMGKDGLISLRSLRSKSASGEDFASTGSFAMYCKTHDAQRLSECDISVVL